MKNKKLNTIIYSIFHFPTFFGEQLINIFTKLNSILLKKKLVKNSRPLPKNFKQLFKKRRFLFIAILLIIFLGPAIYIVTKSPKTVEAGWWDEMWHYRKSIVITAGDTILTDYQVKIDDYNTSTDISTGKMQTDCGDLRFTSSSGVELPYWIESGCNSSTTDIWIKVDSIPDSGSTTIYMYYGNQSANSNSNADATFEFFDDFDADTSDDYTITKQVVRGSGDGFVWDTANSELESDTSNDCLTIHTPTSLPKLYVWSSALYTGDNDGYGIFIKSSSTFYEAIITTDHPGPTDGIYTRTSGEPSIAQATSNSFDSQTTTHEVGIGYNGTQFKMYVDGVLEASYNASITPNGFGLTSEANSPAATYSNLIARKYTTTEPTAASPGSEEKGTTPIAYWSFDEGYGTTVHNQMEKVGEKDLVGWWKFNEGVGTTALDEMNINTATLGPGNSAPSWTTTAKSGTALDFDGVDDYAEVTDSGANSEIDLGETGTVMTWVKVDNFATSKGIVARGSSGTWLDTNYGLVLRGDYSGTKVSGIISNGSNTDLIYSESVSGGWHHVALTWNGERVKIYTDGILGESEAQDVIPADDGDPLRFGVWGAIGRTMDGQIDNVKIFKRALSEGEISAEYNSIQGHMIDMDPASDWVDGAQPNPNQKPMGKALDFDGSNDYINLDSSVTNLEGANTGTYTGWFKSGTTSPNQYLITITESTGTTDFTQVGFNASTGAYADESFWFYLERTNATKLAMYVRNGETFYADDNWHHFAVATGDGDNRILIDGVRQDVTFATGSVSTNEFSNIDTPNSMRIGARKLNSAELFSTTQIDEVKVYDFALSDSQVEIQYNRGFGQVMGVGSHAGVGATGPVGFWKLDEAGGYTAFDSSDNDNTGVFGTGSSAPSWKQGKVGKALEFDGTNDYVNVGNDSSLEATTAITVSAWIYPHSATAASDEQFIVSKRGSGAPYNYQFGLNWTKAGTYVDFDFYHTSTWFGYVTTTYQAPLNTWTHLTAVYESGSDAKIYVNGSEVAVTQHSGSSDPDMQANSAHSVYIGCMEAGCGNSNAFDGLIDHVKMYNYARTPEQIHYDMATGSPFVDLRFDEGAGLIAFSDEYATDSAALASTHVGNTAWTYTDRADPLEAVDIEDNGDYYYLAGNADGRGSPNFDGTGAKVQKRRKSDHGLEWTQSWCQGGCTNYDKYSDIKEEGDYIYLVGAGTYGDTWRYERRNKSDGSIDWGVTTDPVPNGHWGKRIGGFDMDNTYIYAVGQAKLTTTDFSSYIQRRNKSDGGLQNTRSLNPTATKDLLYDAVIDDSYIYAVGIQGSGGTDATWWIEKSNISDVSNEQTVTYDSAGTGTDLAMGVDIAEGYIYVVGYDYDGGTTSARLEKRRTSDLSLEWSIIPFDGYYYEVKEIDGLLYIAGYEVVGDAEAIVEIRKASDGTLISKYNSDPSAGTDAFYNIDISNDQIIAVGIDYQQGSTYQWFWEELLVQPNAKIIGPGWTSGAKPNPNQKPMGKALDYDGVDDYVKMHNDFNIPTTVSLSLWVYEGGSDDNAGLIFSSDYLDATEDWGLRYYATAGNLGFRDYHGGTDSYVDTGVDIDSGVWTHIALIVNGSTIYPYKNGIAYDSVALNQAHIARTLNDLRIGQLGGYIESNYHFKGKIDEVKFFNYDLSTDQVKVEYNRGRAMVLGAGASESDPNLNSPIGWWKMDEANGYTVFDSSGNNNNGSLGAGALAPNWAQGKIGKALDFDGTNDYVDLPDDLGYTTSVSAFTWFKHEGTPAGDYHIIFGGQELEISIPISTGALRTGVYTTSRYVSNHGSGLTDGAWHYIGFTFDGSTKKSYVDGIYVGEQTGITGTLTSSFSNRRMGRHGSSGTYYMNGLIDNAKIFDSALTDAQIAWEYNQGKPIAHYSLDEKDGEMVYNQQEKQLGSNDLISWWKMNAGVGTSAVDTIGGFDGTLGAGSSAPTWTTSGRLGNALDFDGTNDYVNIGDESNLEGMEAITAMAWIKLEGSSASSQRVISKFWDGTNRSWMLYTGSDDAVRFLLATDDSNTNAIAIGSTASRDEWHHIAGTWDADTDTINVYLDGVGVGSIGQSGDTVRTNTAPVFVGLCYYNNTYAQPFNGKIDDVKVYNRALSEAEIFQEYSSSQGQMIYMDASTDHVSGKFNNGLDFDGSNDFVDTSITSNNKLDIKGPITYSAWFKRDSAGTYQTIVSKLDTCTEANADGFALRFYGTNELRFEGFKTDHVFTVEYTNSTLYNDTTNWHHVVGSWDGTTDAGGAKLYVDGQLVAQDTSTADSFISLDGYNQSIGALPCNAHFFNGKIDEVKVYSYELTPKQIQVDYNNSKAVSFR